MKSELNWIKQAVLLVDYHAIVVTVDHDGPTASQVDIFLPPITDLEPKQSKYPFRSLKTKRSGVKEKTTPITIHTPIHLHFYVFQRLEKMIFQTCLFIFSRINRPVLLNRKPSFHSLNTTTQLNEENNPGIYYWLMVEKAIINKVGFFWEGGVTN